MYAEQFDCEGYVHVQQAIDLKTISELRALALAELQKQKSRLVTDTVQKYEPIRSLLDRPKLRDALTEVFGTPFLVLPPTSIDHNGFGLFHTDTTGIELSGKNFHRDPNFRAAVLAVYLQDNDQHGGGIRIVPGGHREPDPFIEKYHRKHAVQKALSESRFKRLANRYSGGRFFGWDRGEFENLPGQSDVLTKQGDAAFWDMRMPHRASPNLAGTEGLPGGKIALFFTIASDNAVNRLWLDHMRAIGEMQKHRPNGDPPPLRTDHFVML